MTSTSPTIDRTRDKRRLGSRRLVVGATSALVLAATAVAGVHVHRVAFERAYASTPHEVEHVGVADPPAATFDDRVDAVLAQAPSTGSKDLARLQHSLHRAGRGAPDGSYGQIDAHTLTALREVLSSAPQDSTFPSPADVARYLESEQTAYLASIHDLVSPHTTRTTARQTIDSLAATDDLDQYLYVKIGRFATDSEVTRFVAYFDRESSADPSVTVTTKTPALDEDGLPIFVDGKQQYSDVKTVKSGGITVDGALTGFVESDSELSEEAQEYAVVGYTNALSCAIRSTDDPC